MAQKGVQFRTDISIVNDPSQLTNSNDSALNCDHIKPSASSPSSQNPLSFDCLASQIHQNRNHDTCEVRTTIKKNYVVQNSPRILLGLLYGVLMAFYLYFWLLKRVPSNPEAPIRQIISISIGLFTGIILAVLCVRSTRLRCTLCVAVPEMCTNRGRAVVVSIITALLISGPINNIIINSYKMHNSTQCVVGMVKELSESHSTQIKNYRGMLGELEKLLQEILLTAERMQERLKKAKEQVDKILEKSKPLVEAYQGFKCLGGFINCERVNLSNPIAYDDYNKSSLSDVAIISAKDFNESVRIVNTNDLVSVKDQLKRFFKSVLTNFNNYTLVLNTMLSLSVFLIFRHANYYVVHYYAEDAYDNHLIDKKIGTVCNEIDSEQDEHLEDDEHQRESFKLCKWEKKYFLSRKSLRFTAIEKSSFRWSLLPTIVLSVFVICIAAADYLLHWGINVITEYGSMSLYVVLPAKTTVSRLGRRVGQPGFRVGHINVTTQLCLPRAEEPQLHLYIAIFVLILFCFVSSMLQAYCRRVRSLICKLFYPKREVERMNWLRSTIDKGRVRRPGKMFALMENEILKHRRRKECEIQFLGASKSRSLETNSSKEKETIKLPYCAACKKRPKLLTRIQWAIKNDPSAEEFKGRAHEFFSETERKYFVVQLCDDCYPYRDTAIEVCQLCKPCADCQKKWYKTQMSLNAIN